MTRILIAVIASVGLLLAQADQQQPLAVGDRAPELRCKNAAGRELTWRDFGERAVVVYFHSQEMAFSRRGFEALCTEFAAAPDLKQRVALLVVGSGSSDAGWLREQIDRSGVPGELTADPDRSVFQRYQAVAFPTVYCLTPERTIAHVTKGFGPLLGSKVAAGARLAAGLLDEQGFRAALQKQEVAEGTEESLHVARSVRMAEQLFRAGMLAEARSTIEKVLSPDSRSVDGRVLLIRVLLAQGQRDAAAPHLERLAALQPAVPELAELRAEIALLGGDAEGALRHLEGADERKVSIAWIKGRALEHLQRFREAAAAYKKALDSVLEQAR